jgi:hypothetical protein
MDLFFAPDAAEALPRCPFAAGGLNSPRMVTCPGFESEFVDFAGLDVPGDYDGKAPHPSGNSCAHLVAAVSARGHRPACAHPDGLPTTWPVSTELRGVPLRRRERTLTGNKWDLR